MAEEGEPAQQKKKHSVLQNPSECPRYIQVLTEKEPVHESPININITNFIEIQLPPLEWHNFEVPPKKMKVTNSGYTLILSGKWHQERPYLCAGPLLSNFVFSQAHFHWGKNDAEGSEHTVDGTKHPVEMHAVFFKANYLTQEAALKEKDGIIVLAYLFKLQSANNPIFQIIIDKLREVQKPHTSSKLDPVPLNKFLRKFEKDYFLYWGSVATSVCLHYILWLITREPVGISAEQVEELRTLLDANDEPLQGNFRETQPLNDRSLFHACPSGSKYATLLPLP